MSHACFTIVAASVAAWSVAFSWTLAWGAQATPAPVTTKIVAAVLFAGAGAEGAVPVVRSALHEVARERPAMEFLTEAALAQRFAGGGVEAKIAACGTDLTCVASIGRNANASEVLYGRVTTVGSGRRATVKLQALVLSCADATVLRKVTVSASPGDLVSQLRERVDVLFGVAVEAPVPPSVAATEPPMPVVHEPPAAVVIPTTTLETPTTARVSSQPWWRRSHNLSRVAAGLGVLGAGSVAAGVFFGMRTAGANDDLAAIEHGMGGTTQLDARDMEDRADSSAQRANVLYGVGAVIGAVAAGLVGVDWLVIASAPQAQAGQGGHPATVVGGTWAW